MCDSLPAGKKPPYDYFSYCCDCSLNDVFSDMSTTTLSSYSPNFRKTVTETRNGHHLPSK